MAVFLEEIKCFCLFKQMHRGTPTIMVAGDPWCRNVVYFLDVLPMYHTWSHTPNYINALVCDEALIKTV